MRTIRAHPLAAEIVDIHKALNALFGISTGKQLLRSVQEKLSLRFGAPARVPITREGAHGYNNAADLVVHFPAYHAALKMRLELAKAGKGNRGHGALVEIGRRFSAVDFVAFFFGLLRCE